ncbi:MAG: hypothetical protein AB7F43_14310 [Bacteriovoracia bacterium]
MKSLLATLLLFFSCCSLGFADYIDTLYKKAVLVYLNEDNEFVEKYCLDFPTEDEINRRWDNIEQVHSTFRVNEEIQLKLSSDDPRVACDAYIDSVLRSFQVPGYTSSSLRGDVLAFLKTTGKRAIVIIGLVGLSHLYFSTFDFGWSKKVTENLQFFLF